VSSAFGALLLLAACSSDSKAPAKETPGKEVGDAATPSDAATPRKPDAFNGDCTTANWSTQSSACWACMCDTCATTLNACNEDCTSLFSCGLQKHAFVGVAAELACEARAFEGECLQDPATSSQDPVLTQFDICLLTSHKAPELLRACEAECDITYTDDVCQRYPATDGGTK